MVCPLLNLFNMLGMRLEPELKGGPGFAESALTHQIAGGLRLPALRKSRSPGGQARPRRRSSCFLREPLADCDDPRQWGKALLGEKRGLWRYPVGDESPHLPLYKTRKSRFWFSNRPSQRGPSLTTDLSPSVNRPLSL